ncbi:MAG TPA: hypothetical protein VGD91_03940 [Trebonia sp.]
MIRASSGKTAAGRLLFGAGVLALASVAVAGCEAGSNAPTLEFHSANSGAMANLNGIQISDAFVLGAPSGATVPSGSSAGLFVAFYNGGNTSDTLMSARAAGAASSVTLPGGSVSLPANSAGINLTGPSPKVVLNNLTKPLNGGTFVPVTFDFAHAGTVTLQVPVEAQDYAYSSFSPPAGTPAGTATPASTAVPTIGVSPSGSAQPSGTASQGAGSNSGVNSGSTPASSASPSAS